MSRTFEHCPLFVQDFWKGLKENRTASKSNQLIQVLNDLVFICYPPAGLQDAIDTEPCIAESR
jgi:hypothetical protein